MSTQILVPTLGESVAEATVATWLKQPGDTVTADEPLVELETDKVTLEVPAPASGVLAGIEQAEGANVEVGALLGLIAEGGAEGQMAVEPVEPAAAPAVAASDDVQIVVPTLGESVTEATVSSWLKQPGDAVAADEPLLELETDKVTLEVPAPAAGTLVSTAVGEGDTVGVGAVLGLISASGTVAAAAAPKVDTAPQAAASKSVDKPLSPAVAKHVAETGVDPSKVAGTGKGGRLTKGDVLSAAAAGTAVAAAASAAPAAAKAASIPASKPMDSNQAGREERVRMSRLRQTIASRLKAAQNSAAMLTTYNEADMSAVMALRTQYKDAFLKTHGTKLGFMSFFVAACNHALKAVPEVNAEIQGDEVVYKNYYNIGVAVGTEAGLVVPVIKDADQMGFAEIENTISDFGVRARDGKLSMAEMQGGTFTISNGGVYGSLMSSPILNAPQSGILGMHKIQQRAMVVDGQIVIRPMMYLALSYDHRIVDGKGAVTFLVKVKEAIEDPARLVMGV